MPFSGKVKHVKLGDTLIHIYLFTFHDSVSYAATLSF